MVAELQGDKSAESTTAELEAFGKFSSFALLIFLEQELLLFSRLLFELSTLHSAPLLFCFMMKEDFNEDLNIFLLDRFSGEEPQN